MFFVCWLKRGTPDKFFGGSPPTGSTRNVRRVLIMAFLAESIFCICVPEIPDPMKTVFNNLILIFNFLLLGVVTVIAIKLIVLGGSGSDLIAGYPSLIAPAIVLAIAFFRLAYPERWRHLLAGFSATGS